MGIISIFFFGNKPLQHFTKQKCCYYSYRLYSLAGVWCQRLWVRADDIRQYRFTTLYLGCVCVFLRIEFQEHIQIHMGIDIYLVKVLRIVTE